MRKYIVATALIAGLVIPAVADETVIKERHEDAGVAVKVPVPGVEVRDHDCASKTVTKENAEGDTKTVHKTQCD